MFLLIPAMTAKISISCADYFQGDGFFSSPRLLFGKKAKRQYSVSFENFENVQEISLCFVKIAENR